MTSLTKEACAPLGVKPRDAERSKNFFALGLISWMYTRPERADARLDHREVRQAARWSRDANLAAFRAGYDFGETAELFDHPYQVKPAPQKPGAYTNITGNTALAWGLVAAGQLAQLPVFLGSYPITPASDILHELSKHKNFGVRTLQAEDEIAGIGAALGAAFGGHLGVTTTSGPGVALKSETIGLAISLELPLLIIDIQRGGPSTGLPTKTEQADLLLAMYGRHGESPLPIVAAYSPSHCFDGRHRGGPHRADVPHAGDPAVRRLPGQRLRAVAAARRRRPARHHRRRRSPPSPTTPATTASPSSGRTCAIPRRWPARGRCPGTPGLEHRIGGIEKEDGSRQHHLRPGEPRAHGRPAGRQDRRHRRRHPAVEVDGDADDAELLVVGWGSTWGAIDGARRPGPRPRAQGGPGPPRAPQPVPAQPRRGAAPLPQGARARDEPRPAVPPAAGRVPGRRPAR